MNDSSCRAVATHAARDADCALEASSDDSRAYLVNADVVHKANEYDDNEVRDGDQDRDADVAQTT